MAYLTVGNYRIFVITKATTFKALCAAHAFSSPQACFYELRQRESVSAKKSLVAQKGGKWILDTSKIRDTLSHLGLTGAIAPKDLPPDFSLFVQSTSHNRLLQPGTRAIVDVTGERTVEAKQDTSVSAPKTSKRPASAIAGHTSSTAAAHPAKRLKGDVGAEEPMTRDDKDGWKWYGSMLFYEHGHTEDVLKELHNNGFKLVIMTNQSAIGTAKASFEKTLAEKKGRLEGFVKKIGLPCQIFVASGKDDYRKPATGMWKFMERSANGGVKVQRAKSLFAGDAAGRPKDHSDSDLKFAKAVGVKFFTETTMFKDRAYKSLI